MCSVKKIDLLLSLSSFQTKEEKVKLSALKTICKVARTALTGLPTLLDGPSMSHEMQLLLLHSLYTALPPHSGLFLLIFVS